MNTLLQPPRVVVVGSSCAGKSTFATALAGVVGAKYVELDELHLGPNWSETPAEEFRRRVAEAVRGESWVVAGNYAQVRDLLWPRANTLVWLNYSFPRVCWQGLSRTVRRCVRGEVLWNGNRESIRRSFFSRESILLWVLSTYHRRKREFAGLRNSDEFPNLEWVEFRYPWQARRWLDGLSLPARTQSHAVR
jgi:adenylate kinase family enzyme